MKIPPPIIDADTAGKKAPVKAAKGAITDELKPVFGRAWINFEDLL